MAKKLTRSFNERSLEQVNQTYNTLTAAINTSFRDAVFLENDIFYLKRQDEIDAIKTAEMREVKILRQCL
jgi:hypothetical protein